MFAKVSSLQYVLVKHSGITYPGNT